MAFGRRTWKGRACGALLVIVLGVPLSQGRMPAMEDGPVRASERWSLWTEEERAGVLEVLVEDHPGGARRSYAVRQAAHRFKLRGNTAALSSARTGMWVRVRGYRRGAEIVATRVDLEGLSDADDARPPEAPITRRVALLLLAFSDRALPPASADAARAVLTNVAGFFRETSYGQLSLEGDVFGEFALPMSATVCDPFRLAEEAHAAAAAAGIALSAYAHWVYVFPKNACSWWGLGTLGGMPSSAWINGTLAFDVLAHEVGHGLGLSHSHALDCGWVALAETCQVLEYGDTLDVMGMGSGHLSAVQKEQLGWLSEGAGILRVTEEGTFRVAPYQVGGDGPKALKIFRSAGPEPGSTVWYYVEYRPPLGFDRFLARNPNVPRGVVIRLGISGDRGGSFLLDLTPETASWLDPALTVGRSFTDPRTGLTLTVREVTESGALVAISGIE